MNYREKVINALAKQLTGVIDPSPASPEEVLETLRHLTTCYMSVLCPGCRVTWAEHLHQTIPHMLAEADQIASVDTDPRQEHLH
jgi:hypothetical protein